MFAAETTSQWILNGILFQQTKAKLARWENMISIYKVIDKFSAQVVLYCLNGWSTLQQALKYSLNCTAVCLSPLLLHVGTCIKVDLSCDLLRRLSNMNFQFSVTQRLPTFGPGDDTSSHPLQVSFCSLHLRFPILPHSSRSTFVPMQIKCKTDIMMTSRWLMSFTTISICLNK